MTIQSFVRTNKHQFLGRINAHELSKIALGNITLSSHHT